jgi:hypothetical protein
MHKEDCDKRFQSFELPSPQATVPGTHPSGLIEEVNVNDLFSRHGVVLLHVEPEYLVNGRVRELYLSESG